MMKPESAAGMSEIHPRDEAGKTPFGEEWGWYLYGIIEQPPADSWSAGTGISHGSTDIQFLQQAGVTAVVRSVQVAEYEPEVIRARARDARWLELMATHHHKVIESIHRLRPILPATFGCVYADEDGLRLALSDLREALLARLQWVADCDEWTVHLYGDASALEQRLIREHPRLQDVQREIASAPPGRAYLLKRKLTSELADVLEQAIAELAGKEYARIGDSARAGAIQAQKAIAHDPRGETELLRAVFLVPRADLPAFRRQVEEITTHGEGMRGEYSGPWPPYSFARLEEERLGGY